MTEEHSDNSNTDNEESEVKSVTQTIEANGEMIDKEALIHVRDEEEADKGPVFTSVSGI